MNKLPVFKGGEIAAYTLVDADDHLRFKDTHLFLMSDGYVGIRVRVASCRWRNDRLHRRIMNAAAGFVVDHRNHDRLDNRKANLRVCRHAQNSHNRLLSKRNRSGATGVCWNKARRKWQVSIMTRGKRRLVGHYESLEAAITERDRAALQDHGAFASLNQPKQTA